MGDSWSEAASQPTSTIMSSSDLSPRAKLNYESDNFVVEFNVAEYKPEELHIKTEGDTLIVSAKQESKTSTGKSFISKQFEQRFSLPSGVNPEKISSKLGLDGMLRITAPRENVGGWRRQEAVEDRSSSSNSRSVNTTSNKEEGLPEPSIKHEKDKLEISIDVREYRPDDLDVKVENNNLIISAKHEIRENNEIRTKVFEQKFSLPPGINPESVRSNLTREGTLVVTATKEIQDNSRYVKDDSTKSLSSQMDNVMSPSSWDTRRESAFDDIRRDSLSDEKRIMSAFDDLRRDSAKTSSLFDRSLFDDKSIFASNSEQSGISRVEYDDNTYKILVNVDKYSPEELVIKTIDNTVVVEAKHKEKTSDGRSYSTQSFSQSFTLPRGVDPESVKSSLSGQGILTIAAPMTKPVKSQQERLVPIKHI